MYKGRSYENLERRQDMQTLGINLSLGEKEWRSQKVTRLATQVVGFWLEGLGGR